MSMYTLSTPITEVHGVGPVMQHHLEEINIQTVGDLLYTIPTRYEHFTQAANIASAPLEESINITATVRTITKFRSKRGLMVIRTVLEDQSGKLDAMWFNQEYLFLKLKKGTTWQFSGKITLYKEKKVMSNPLVEDTLEQENIHTASSTPIYPQTAAITSRWLRKIIHHVFQHITSIPDSLPKKILEAYRLAPLDTTLRSLHFPEKDQDLSTYLHRLAFEEVFFMLAQAKKSREDIEHEKVVKTLKLQQKDVQAFIKALPYIPTQSQTQTFLDLALDFIEPHPSNRLIQGEVGSGKTTIAAFALYSAAINQTDAVFIAPTQLVAHQHYETIRSLLAPFHIPILELIGNTRALPTQKGTVVVGTHAILAHLHTLHPAVVVIDEEHRFGVEQRDLFWNVRTKKPHMITMTATPIPRTIALTVLSDRNISHLEEIPAKKKQIITRVIPEIKRADAYAWIDAQINTLHTQVFIVCPFIDQSTKETLSLIKSAEQEYIQIKKLFPKRTVALLHGNMNKEVRQKIFTNMKNGTIDILVATPLIEVGIDIPQASIMVIEGAERFGLAQLHQLRGRIGRAGQKAYCFLFPSKGIPSTKRLKMLESCNDGNTLAELDLKLRGSGELFGLRQHGWDTLRFASLFDEKLITACKKAID